MRNGESKRIAWVALFVVGIGAEAAIAQQNRRAAGRPAPVGRGYEAGTRAPAMDRTEKAYPTGDRATSILLLERLTPAEVRRGDRIVYEIRLTNLTAARISDVALIEQFPPTFRVDSASPEPGRREGSQATWRYESIGPGASELIRIQGATDREAELNWCATVTFNTVACARTRIVEPELTLSKSAPSEVLLCDEIPLRFVVANKGSGVARRVRIADDLPAGLSLANGETRLVFDAGDLGAGESREFGVVARASRAGEFRNSARASDDSGLSATAEAATIVRKPELEVTKTAPAMRFVGRPAEFEIVVRNTGDAPARDTILTDAIPLRTEFVRADGAGQFSAGRVNWRLGTIAPGETRTVHVQVRCADRGVAENRAVARAYCAEGTASATIDIKGIPAILLEVVDLDDPIEVGADVTYEIVVTNQGSSDGTNILVECVLPPEEQFVSATGPSSARADGQTVRFERVPVLRPKARLTYRVIVRGIRPGDLRFGVSLQSDQTDSPVTETESTHAY